MRRLLTEHDHSHGHEAHAHKSKKVKDTDKGKLDRKRVYTDSVITSGSVTPTQEEHRGRSRSRSDSMYGHPAATRARVVQEAQELQRARSPSATRTGAGRFFDAEDNSFEDEVVVTEVSESTPLLGSQNGLNGEQSTSYDFRAREHTSEGASDVKQPTGHARSGSMNMRALVLHVLGDALGNAGVIATGLVIWLSNLSWKYYFDPIISLVITCIIFSSALPLGRFSLHYLS